jgi:hypothetical protein
MSDDKKEVSAAGESAVPQPASPQVDLPPAPRNENQKEVAAAGESTVPQPASPQADLPPAPRNENQKEVATAGESAVPQPASPQADLPPTPRNENQKEVATAGESTVPQPASPQVDLPSTPRNEDQKEVATAGERAISQPASLRGDSSLAPRKKNKVTSVKEDVISKSAHPRVNQPPTQKGEHRITHIAVWVELCLILATAALAIVTYRDTQEGKNNTSVLEQQARKFDSDLSGLTSEVGGLKSEVNGFKNIGTVIARKTLAPDPGRGRGGSTRPSPVNGPIVVDGDFKDCSVTGNGERWLLHEADLCYYLGIPLKNQDDNVDYRVHTAIKFYGARSSWTCSPPADRTIPAGAVRDITIDLTICFLRHQQERRGDIEFSIMMTTQEER